MKQHKSAAGATSWRPPTKQARWGDGDGHAMLAALAASKMSERKFARHHGIGPQRVHYWRAKLEKAKSAGFVRVQVRERAEPAIEERRVEAQVGAGARLVFVGSWDAAAIAPWIRAMRSES